MFAIVGGTGNTGKPIALGLLNAGKKVRVLSRSSEKAKELADKGAEVIIGNLDDPAAFSKLFNGAEAAYILIPPNYSAPDFYEYQKHTSDLAVDALKNSSVKYVITLSSVGADLDKDSGVVLGLHYLEQKLNLLPGINALHLRPTYFMENTFGQIGVINNMGAMGSPVKADLKINMIASKDIAAYALKRFLALDFKGVNVQYLLGQRDLTYTEVASIYGKEIGKPDLKYTELPYEGLKAALVQMGASEDLANSMNTFTMRLNEGKVLRNAKRDSESTTPTSIEEFAKTFAHVFNGK